MEYVTYTKYQTEKEAEETINLLNVHGINYIAEKIYSPLDSVIIGGPVINYSIELKIKLTDFVKVDEILSEISDNNLESVINDHYLNNFTNEELIEIIEKFDEWNNTDFLLAKKILLSRGINVSNEKVQELREKRLLLLSKKKSKEKIHFSYFYKLGVFLVILGLGSLILNYFGIKLLIIERLGLYKGFYNNIIMTVIGLLFIISTDKTRKH